MKNTFLIIGEGATEYYFLNSLKDDFRSLQNISPKYPKHTSINQLESAIKEGINQGFTKVLCMIDMDNKKEGSEKAKYLSLKKKYHKKRFLIQKQGIDCFVRFFETERCTELFFLFYFKFTTKLFESSDQVVYDLNKLSGYEKTKSFFQKHPLHPFFISKGGSLQRAINNSNKSLKESGLRGHTYSELGELFAELGIE